MITVMKKRFLYLFACFYHDWFSCLLELAV